jgi:hypothetical protein
MHLIETYALACGAKIDEPFIYESFTPLPEGKYISFHTNTKFNSKNYDYWQDVIGLLLPILAKENIKIVQTGGPNDPAIAGAIDYRGRTTVNQLAYIVKRSALHFGCDSFAIHLASAFNIPIVALYNIIQPENAGPYFGDKSQHIVFKCYERLGQKPSYASDENPKTINTIFPEEIVEAILKLLGIAYAPAFRTIHIGDGYGRIQINDFVPNQVVNVHDKKAVLDVRMDYLFDEEILARQLRVNRCRIFTDRRINLQILAANKAAIEGMFYFIRENDEPAFVREVAELGIRCALLCNLPSEQIERKKIDYYEHANINVIPKIKPELLEKLKKINNLHFKSCRNVHSEGKVYASRASQIAGVVKTEGFQPVIDSPDFWNDEAENCMFVEMLDKTRNIP